MNNEHDPHAENKRLYDIDVALVGEDEAPKRWQYRFKGDDNYRGAWITPMGSMFTGGGEYRRDPSAPPLPSLAWHAAPAGACFMRRGEKWYDWHFSVKPVCESGEIIETRPPKAWFNLTYPDYVAREAGEGWVAWHGNASGKCPLPDGTRFRVYWAERDAPDSGTFVAPKFYWKHSGNCGDIIAYRVIEPASDDALNAVANGEIQPYTDDHADEPADDGVLSGGDLHRAIADAMDDASSEWWKRFEIVGDAGDFPPAEPSTIYRCVAKGFSIRRKPVTRPAKDAPMNKPLPAQCGSAWHPGGHVPADDCDPRLEREIERLAEQYISDYSEYKEIVERLASDSTATGQLHDISTNLLPRLQSAHRLSDMCDLIIETRNVLKTLCDSIDDAAESMAREELK